MRSLTRVLAILGIAAAIDGQTTPVSTERPPDIVLIMSDDMGYSDIGCYGGEIRTPHLDALAHGGLRFSQFYNTARCCPTRASLLTGLYPHQAGVGHMLAETSLPGYTGGLNDRCVTIAEALRPAGYRTYMSGKWHVTRHTAPNGPKDCWPLQRGFDRFYGTIIGAGSFFDPATLCRGNTYITPENDLEYRPETYYYTDAISDNAEAFLRAHCGENADRPLFLYVSYTAAHWPMQALARDIKHYTGAYDDGYDAVRNKRLDRLRALGLVDEGWEMSPPAGGWDDVPADRRAWERRSMEVYGAMVESMDRGIGRIVAALRETGRLDNTLILFLQDNGGCAESFGRTAPRKPYPDYRPMDRDQLQTKIWPPMQTRDGRPVRVGPEAMPGPEDTFVSYGRGWANVSNTPFREYKHWVHEGGIATPLIAHWPRGIDPERHGVIEPQPGHLIDVMATCVAVAGASYPKERNGTAITPMAGVSLVPAFRGESLNRQDALYWEHEANCAIRDGRLKLVCKGRMSDGVRQPWELYDMEADRTELNDLAGERPELVAELAAKWETWAERAKVKPWPWQAPELSKRTRFELGPGAALKRSEAPNLAGKAFTVTARVQLGKGVIVAQGGASLGYALYVADGKLCFATRHQGKLTLVRCTAPAMGSRTTVTASLQRDGTVELAVDGAVFARAVTPGPIPMPVDGLEVGRDAKGLVGRYGADNAFTGTIESVVVELNR